jgi:hypothetical protein
MMTHTIIGTVLGAFRHNQKKSAFFSVLTIFLINQASCQSVPIFTVLRCSKVSSFLLTEFHCIMTTWHWLWPKRDFGLTDSDVPLRTRASSRNCIREQRSGEAGIRKGIFSQVDHMLHLLHKPVSVSQNTCTTHRQQLEAVS